MTVTCACFIRLRHQRKGVQMLLTAEEIAKILRVRKDNVYRMVREGILPAVHIGKTVRIDAEKFQKWIDSGGQQFEGGWRKQVSQMG